MCFDVENKDVCTAGYGDEQNANNITSIDNSESNERAKYDKKYTLNKTGQIQIVLE